MNIDYDCADCQGKFSISVSDEEMRAALKSTHSENCPDCGQRVGWGFVDYRQCGQSFVVELRHWYIHANPILSELQQAR